MKSATNFLIQIELLKLLATDKLDRKFIGVRWENGNITKKI